jgi:hypothetical protein
MNPGRIHREVHESHKLALRAKFGLPRVPCPFVIDAIKVVIDAMVIRVAIR